MTYAEHDAQAIAASIYQRHGITSPMPTIRVRDVRRGRSDPVKHVITLPLWLWSASYNPDGRDYLEHYVAHELAHELAGERLGHHVEFYRQLYRLDPAGFHRWERDYKPRAWAVAYHAIYGCKPS